MTKEEFDNLPRLCLSCEKSRSNPKNKGHSYCNAYDESCTNKIGNIVKCAKYKERECV